MNMFILPGPFVDILYQQGDGVVEKVTGCSVTHFQAHALFYSQSTRFFRFFSPFLTKLYC